MTDFNYRQCIKEIMDARNVNIAIVELQINLSNHPIFIKGNYKFFVTKEKHKQDLNFFSIKSGVHYKWFSDPLAGYIKFIGLHTITEYNIAEYVDRQEEKHD